MIGYTTIGTSDMEKACAFYDALLGEIGGSQLMGMDRIKFYGTGGEGAMLAICIPYDEQAQMFLPDLSNLALTAGDPPVRIPESLLPAPGMVAYAAMSKDAIGLSVGAGEEQGLHRPPMIATRLFIVVGQKGNLGSAAKFATPNHDRLVEQAPPF